MQKGLIKVCEKLYIQTFIIEVFFVQGMVEIKKDNLEKALESKKDEKVNAVPEMPKEVEIGFHQGSLNTLLNERNEMIKVIQQIEAVMQGHIKRLEALGVKIKVNSNKKE